MKSFRNSEQQRCSKSFKIPGDNTSWLQEEDVLIENLGGSSIGVNYGIVG